jgi:hypothetical protein
MPSPTIESLTTYATSGATSFNVSHTISSGNLLMVSVGIRNYSDVPSSIIYIRWNAVDLTSHFETTISSADGSRFWCETFYMLNPTTGTFDIQLKSSSPASFVFTAMTIEGADTTTPFTDSTFSTPSSGTTNISIQSNSSELVAVWHMASDPSTHSPDASLSLQSEAYTITTSSGTGQMWGKWHTEPGAYGTVGSSFQFDYLLNMMHSFSFREPGGPSGPVSANKFNAVLMG